MWFWKSQPLTDSKLWALGAGGILTQLNSEPFDQILCNSGKQTSRRLLSDDWGIMNADQATQTLTWLWEEGHSHQCASVCVALLEGGELKVQGKLSEFLADRLFQLETFYIRGWDTCRIINVARWAYTSKFISEPVAWDWIMRGAKDIQQTYKSWQEFGDDFCLGFDFWRLCQDHDTSFDLKAINKRLLTETKSPWVKFEFSAPLEE